ncbi:MAG TPA: hypothetical protein VGI69_03005 [Gaiellaceae bacterium]|jgi:hypothetical protein
MANERQKEIGRWIQDRYPKGGAAQQEFKMVLNIYLQHGDPKAEAVTKALSSVRERHPRFVPIER